MFFMSFFFFLNFLYEFDNDCLNFTYKGNKLEKIRKLVQNTRNPSEKKKRKIPTRESNEILKHNYIKTNIFCKH